MIAPAIVAVISIPGHGLAADVAPQPPVISAESVAPDETNSGWYLRGDIGIAVNAAPSMNWQSSSYFDRSAANSASFGAGIGYRFSDTLRADITLDFLTSHRIKGNLTATTEDHLTQDAATVMANGYYDIATFSGVTPYIGAGIGVARVNDDALVRDVSGIGTYTFGGTLRYALAASAMTGFSFDIGHGMQADVGYKFTWIDKTRTGPETSSTLAGPVNIGASGAHQFRVGLKYFIN
jgi:opacity protein-like surface antigen